MTPQLAAIVASIVDATNTAMGQTHARYIGPETGWNVRTGMTAIIKLDVANPGHIFAQFDDFTAQRNGVDLAFGWHSFPADQWEPSSIERGVE